MGQNYVIIVTLCIKANGRRSLNWWAIANARWLTVGIVLTNLVLTQLNCRTALLIAAVSSDACHANITTSPISAAADAGATASVTERCRAFPASASAQYCQQATPSKKSIIVYKGPRPFESSSNGAVADTKYLHVLLMGLSENDMLLSCVALNSCEFGFCFRRIWAKFGTQPASLWPSDGHWAAEGPNRRRRDSSFEAPQLNDRRERHRRARCKETARRHLPRDG